MISYGYDVPVGASGNGVTELVPALRVEVQVQDAVSKLVQRDIPNSNATSDDIERSVGRTTYYLNLNREARPERVLALSPVGLTLSCS